MSDDLTLEQQLKLARALWPNLTWELCGSTPRRWAKIPSGGYGWLTVDLASDEAVGAMVRLIMSRCDCFEVMPYPATNGQMFDASTRIRKGPHKGGYAPTWEEALQRVCLKVIGDE